MNETNQEFIEENQILKQAPRNLLNSSILMDKTLYIEGEKGNEERNTLNVTSKNKIPSAQILNIEVPSFQLPELPTLPNLDNIVAASKVIPHLIPFVVADYKVKLLKLNKNKPYDEVLGAAQLIKLEIHLIV